MILGISHVVIEVSWVFLYHIVIMFNFRDVMQAISCGLFHRIVCSLGLDASRLRAYIYIFQNIGGGEYSNIIVLLTVRPI